MAVHKCCYILFNDDKTEPCDLKLTMNDQPFTRERETTFLCITLDHKLNFKSYIANTIVKSTSQLNAIKTLSHKSWGIDTKTLKQIYNSLMRSIFEYYAVLVNRLSDDLINKL